MTYQDKIREICTDWGWDNLPLLTEDQFQAIFKVVEREIDKAKDLII